MSTFVSVGNANQPFARLLKAVSVLAEKGDLPLPVIVQHGHTPFSSDGCTAIDFMAMEDFAKHVRGAELLIFHAGAGSMIHACQAGKVPVVMPRRACFGEHIDDHQLELVEAFERSGLVVKVDDEKDLYDAAMRATKMQSEKEQGNREEPMMINKIRKRLAEINNDLFETPVS
jgi:UDP-N-acetylglucosamine transferase subunit ALG13